jgi:hypothetical protein
VKAINTLHNSCVFRRRMAVKLPPLFALMRVLRVCRAVRGRCAGAGAPGGGQAPGILGPRRALPQPGS